MLLHLRLINISFKHDIKLFMNDIFNGFFGESCTYTEQLEKGHDRIEKRRCIATDNIYWLQQRHNWSHLKSIAAIETTRLQGMEQHQ